MAAPQAAPSHPPVPMWTGWHTLGLLCIIVVIVLAGLLLPTGARLGAWLLTLLLLAVFAAVAGQGITGLALVGFQGRACAKVVQRDFCHPLIPEARLFPWPSTCVPMLGPRGSLRP